MNRKSISGLYTKATASVCTIMAHTTPCFARKLKPQQDNNFLTRTGILLAEQASNMESLQSSKHTMCSQSFCVQPILRFLSIFFAYVQIEYLVHVEYQALPLRYICYADHFTDAIVPL